MRSVCVLARPAESERSQLDCQSQLRNGLCWSRQPAQDATGSSAAWTMLARVLLNLDEFITEGIAMP